VIWLIGMGAIFFLAATTISFFLLWWLKPLLRRYALATPIARSSHKSATPQGGGIAVVIATAITFAAGLSIFPIELPEAARLAAMSASVAALAIVGFADDIRPLTALSRLILQAVAIAVVVATLSPSLRVAEFLPWWIERVLIFVALLWFVNLVNFMDGIDWMTVAEVVPVTAAIVLLGLMKALPLDVTLLAVCLCGATIGFAPFNRPVAQVFLGDVGSLPIGLLLGWALIQLAGSGYLAAAVMLPLYYLADATFTLSGRLASGAAVMKAHRSHFYQRAFDGGFTAYQIVGLVFGTNVVLAALAIATYSNRSLIFQLIMLVAGCAVVGVPLWTFGRARRTRWRQ
jgi:UDP-N-acetylmuramyl pentapeptide phosphotransferase/UDP-N-acetylglucosamine-1-phosphate transferase